ncbi:putative Phospholipase C [Verrucomicrobia bacterium]|nr:putative Phospholipase C [Verrucomicrobiota bacterium]
MSIQNIVVLMLENRSFDHLLGSLNTLNPSVAGLAGNEFNYADPRNPQSAKTNVTPATQFATPYDIPFDPQHEFADVQMQLYGPAPSANPAQPAVPNAPTPDPEAAPMNGFMVSAIASAAAAKDNFSGDPQQVMEYFSPDQLPVLTALAQNFALFNWWFSSLPGPTWPNRYFIHAATSGGLTDSPTTMEESEAGLGFGFSFTGGTIYDRVKAAGKQWRIYHDGLPQSASIASLWPEFVNPLTKNFRDMSNFQADVAANALPDYTFIEPNYDVSGNYLNGNSMHPLNDIRKGELLVKQVYEALRNSSYYWGRVLLIITFDEHGGFYDHVAPPKTIATGDDSHYSNPAHPFKFDRLGVRVPGLLISAYTKPGTVIDTDSQGNRYVVDHTSALATVEELLGLPPLTQRDKAANKLDVALNLSTENDDAPTSLPDPQAPPLELAAPTRPVPPAAADDAPISKNQTSFLALAHATNLQITDRAQHPAIKARYQTIKRQKEAADYIHEVEQKIRLRRRPPHYFAVRADRKGKHTYHYHPPRADHPLVKSAPKAPKAKDPSALPSSVDLRSLCLAIRDQGQEGACSGFSTAAFRETSHAAASGSLLPGYLSPAYLYARTRIADGTFPADSGASIADEFDILQNRGVCPEAFLPYTANPSEGPTPASDVAALPFRIGQALQVDFKDAAAIKSVLAAKQTITIGFTVYESFENPGPNGVLSMPDTASESLLGGHGVLVCGYDDDNSWWIVRNQWGSTWGAAGYCFMPYGYQALWTEAWTGVPQA